MNKKVKTRVAVSVSSNGHLPAKDGIGLVLVSHCRIAEEMLRAAELILGPLDGVCALSIDYKQSVGESARQLARAVKTVDSGQGVMILTDLYGGTPANLSLALAGPKVAVVCGMNLPMVIKFAECRRTSSLAEVAKLLQEYGRRHISLASQYLKP